MLELGFEEKLKYYEQKYYPFDEPIPFKDDLKIYPVKMKDYYHMYSLIGCYTVDKLQDPNPQCISMSDLDYAFHLMQTRGQDFRYQFFSLLELTFNINNGFFCSNPECKGHEITTFDEIYEDLYKIKNEIIQNKQSQEDFEKRRVEYLTKVKTCPICGSEKIDYIRTPLKANGNGHQLFIGHTEIKKSEYRELKRIFCYQNLPDFNDDYIDPELKEALDEASKLQKGNVQEPTLERQMACIVASTGYTFEDLKKMTVRKFVLLLRVVDSKLNYQITKTASMSGLVTFKGEIEHWIYTKSDARKNRFKDIMTVDQISQKIGSGSKTI